MTAKDQKLEALTAAEIVAQIERIATELGAIKTELQKRLEMAS